MASIRQYFPVEKLGWLVFEIQRLPIFIPLQATACNEGGLYMRAAYPMNFFPNKYKPRGFWSGTFGTSISGMELDY